LAALPRSIRTPAATTGRPWTSPCWPAAACAPATDKEAAYVKERPVSFQNVFATLYHNLGIDPGTAVADRGGRPMSLLDEHEPIRELVWAGHRRQIQTSGSIRLDAQFS
jgi:hypothetical protein